MDLQNVSATLKDQVTQSNVFSARLRKFTVDPQDNEEDVSSDDEEGVSSEDSD